MSAPHSSNTAEPKLNNAQLDQGYGINKTFCDMITKVMKAYFDFVSNITYVILIYYLLLILSSHLLSTDAPHSLSLWPGSALPPARAPSVGTLNGCRRERLSAVNEHKWGDLLCFLRCLLSSIF